MDVQDWRRYIGRIIYAYEVRYTNHGEYVHVESTWKLVSVSDGGVAYVNDSLEDEPSTQERHFAIEQLRTYNKRPSKKKKRKVAR